MRLTLGHLLDHADFGLELRAGGAHARNLPVEGAHSIDLRDPVRWLQEGWIMLTTGVQLRGSAATQRRLVAQLSEGRIAALGLGVGIALSRAPRALLQEADRRAFPVFTVPLETPFREIVSFVNRSALSTDLHVLRRLTSMQRYLLDAVHQATPEQTLVERLASVLGGADVAYLDALGDPVATTAPAVDWAHLVAGEPAASMREIEVDGRRGIVTPVVEGDLQAGSLLVLLASSAVSRQVARPMVRTASELLGLVSVSRLAAARGRRARRAALGARVLRVAGGHADSGLIEALAAEGIDFTRPCRVAVLGSGGRASSLPGLLDTIGRALAGGSPDVVMTAEGSEAVLLAQDELAHLADWLDADPGQAHVRGGISEPLPALEGVAGAVDEARLALCVALATDDGPRVQRHDELEPSVALLGPRSTRALRERLVQSIAPLANEPRLRAAVVAYLEAGLDVGRAAGALGLHRNSVRYRLDRAEELLGRTLRSPDTVATLHLALLAERLGADLRAQASR